MLVFVYNVQQGSVVLVNNNNNLLAALLAGSSYEMGKPVVGIHYPVLYAPFALFHLKHLVKVSLQCVLLHVLAAGKAEVQHGMLHPFGLQLLNGETLKEALLALKVALQGRRQQRLAKTARTGKEYILHIAVGHTIDVFGLVDVQ